MRRVLDAVGLWMIVFIVCFPFLFKFVGNVIYYNMMEVYFMRSVKENVMVGLLVKLEAWW